MKVKDLIELLKAVDEDKLVRFVTKKGKEKVISRLDQDPVCLFLCEEGGVNEIYKLRCPDCGFERTALTTTYCRICSAKPMLRIVETKIGGS